MSGHSLLAPSAAHRWMPCPGSVVLSAPVPDRTSPEAAEGTAAHQVAEWVLRTGVDSASKYPDLEVVVKSNDELETFTTPVDDHLIKNVDSYVDTVRREALGGELLVEQRVDLSGVLGVDDQGGTADAVALSQDGTELLVADLKYGRGVQVYAEGNPQLRLYGLGALEDLDLAGLIETVRLMIVQPRLDHVDEEVMSADDLRAWGLEARGSAMQVGAAMQCTSDDELRAYLQTGESQCRFCPAKARCPALAEVVEEVAFDDVTADPPAVAETPVDADELGRMRALVPLVEQWCKAIVGEVDARLASGEPVTGWKLVEGRRGSRQWADEEAVAKALKSMRLKKDQMYEAKLISPTKAQKILTEKRWEKLEPLIEQKEGKPQAVPETDKRPGLDTVSFEATDEEPSSDSLI